MQSVLFLACRVKGLCMYFYGPEQKEGMGLLEYQAMPSLRDAAHGGVLCTFYE
jgi:hypothetical protein